MENPLKKILNLSFLGLSKKEGSVLGVDIGSSSIKVVQLRRQRGTAILETYGELSLGPYAELDIGQATRLPAEKLAAALTDLLREANTSTTDAALSIPFSDSLTSLIDMPDLPDKELAKMIPIEARKYIPVPIGEVTLDWFVIPEGEKKFLDSEGVEEEKKVKKKQVLVVAIHNEALDKFRDIVKRVSLSVEFFEIEIFSAIRATLGQTLKPVVVIDMGAASTKLYIVEYGIVRATHLINRGGQDVTLALSRSLNMSIAKAEETKRALGLVGGDGENHVTQAILLSLEHIFAEANRVVLGFEKKFNRNVGKVILTGGGATLQGVLPLAQKHLETDVVLADPFTKVEAPAFLETVLREVGPEFSVATGLALRRLQEME